MLRSVTSACQALDSPDGEQQASQFLPAILLAYFASQNRSLLAAECLIETVIEMYRRGTQLDSLQFTLSMETLQSGSTLLSEQELDILTARCGIIMLTLHEIGCETYAEVVHPCLCRLHSHCTQHLQTLPPPVAGLKQWESQTAFITFAIPDSKDIRLHLCRNTLQLSLTVRSSFTTRPFPGALHSSTYA